MAENNNETVADLIALAGEITIAWLQNPNVNPATQDVPAFLKTMHAAITELGTVAEPEPETVSHEPAVSVRSSVKPDHLVSLIDGKKYKTLKRHLGLHGLTPDDYRARYGLKSDYPMVAENYAAQRREIAKALGLGRKPAPAPAPEAAPEAAVEAPAAKPKRAGKAKVVAQVAAAPAEPKAAPRKAGKVTKAAPEVAAPAAPAEKAPAVKAKRMARPAVAETPGAAEATAPEAGAPAKPKARKPKAASAPAETPKA